MSQTYSKVPSQRIPPLEQSLGKIRDSQQKQLKVLKAHLLKKDRSQVQLALRQFKEQRASETAKDLLEEKIYRIKELNEYKVAKVAQRKAVIEAQKEKKS